MPPATAERPTDAVRGVAPVLDGTASPGRLVVVVNDAGFLLSHRLPVVLGARAAGWDVHLALPRAAGRVDELEALGFPVHDLPLDRRGMNPWAEARLLARLLALYRALQPPTVHHVTVKPVLYGSLAARVAGVPRVVNAVSGLGYLHLARGWRARLARRAVHALYRVAFDSPGVRVIFQNPDDRDAYVGAGLVRAERACLVAGGSGVDLVRFRPTPEPAGCPVVMLPARLLRDKGVGEFVEAARALRARGVVARFVLVGETDANRAAVPRAELTALAAEGVVEWWGRREDMPVALAEATLVVLPSYREGCPKVLLEAAACGRAMVTTDVPDAARWFATASRGCSCRRVTRTPSPRRSRRSSPTPRAAPAWARRRAGARSASSTRPAWSTPRSPCTPPARGAERVRALVTGATGFVGRPTCLALRQAGLDVRAAVRDPDAAGRLPRGASAHVVGDITSRRSPGRGRSRTWTWSSTSPRACTSWPTAAWAPRRCIARPNVDATLRLARAAAAAGVRRLVFVSSGEAVGESSEHPLTEASPPVPARRLRRHQARRRAGARPARGRDRTRGGRPPAAAGVRAGRGGQLRAPARPAAPLAPGAAAARCGAEPPEPGVRGESGERAGRGGHPPARRRWHLLRARR
jgi:glycosyltransferase involved in cell wall biosynthesis